MCKILVLYTRLIVAVVVVVLFAVCQDLLEGIACTAAKEDGDCRELPWSAKCRKTCELCGKFKTE